MSALVYPFSLIGVPLSPSDLPAMLLPVLFSATALAGACAWINRAAVPLEAAQ